VAQAAALAALQEQLSAEWQQELDTQRGQLVSQPPAERRHPAAAAPPLADATPCYAHSAVYWVAVPRVLHPLRPSNGAWHGYWVAVPRGLPCGDVSVGARFSCLVRVRWGAHVSRGCAWCLFVRLVLPLLRDRRRATKGTSRTGGRRRRARSRSARPPSSCCWRSAPPRPLRRGRGRGASSRRRCELRPSAGCISGGRRRTTSGT
jgi:hypothetical protein